MHPWRTGGLVGAALGVLVGGFMMSVAWQHNAQGEIHDELGFDWGYWLLIGASWFVPATLVSAAVLSTVEPDDE